MLGYIIIILTFVLIQIFSWKQTHYWRNECYHFEREHKELQKEKLELLDQQQLQKTSIAQWQVAIHQLAITKGWYMGPRAIPELLCLLHSEISEALEVYRNSTNDHLPPAFAEELADIFIRLADMAEYLEINLEEAIIAKYEYNKTRPFRHGNKQC